MSEHNTHPHHVYLINEMRPDSTNPVNAICSRNGLVTLDNRGRLVSYCPLRHRLTKSRTAHFIETRRQRAKGWKEEVYASLCAVMILSRGYNLSRLYF